jgi:hypothetical protein
MRFLVVEINERGKTAAISQGWWATEVYEELLPHS